MPARSLPNGISHHADENPMQRGVSRTKSGNSSISSGSISVESFYEIKKNETEEKNEEDPSKLSAVGIECVLQKGNHQTTTATRNANHDNETTTNRSKKKGKDVKKSISASASSSSSTPGEEVWEDALSQLKSASSSRGGDSLASSSLTPTRRELLNKLREQRVQEGEKEEDQQQDQKQLGNVLVRYPILMELIRPPNEAYWNEKLDCNKPRTLWRRSRLLTGKFLENTVMQMFIISLIIINSITMGIETFDFVTNNPKVSDAFNLTDNIFLTIFTVELGMQFYYRSLALFQDGWLIFDVVIVITSWSFDSLQIVRAFRSFRAFRLITRVGPLRDLVAAIGEVMPRMYAIGILLLLIFYIFSVLFTQLFGDLQFEEDYFSTLDKSLFTCMQLMTLEWAQIARETMAQVWWAWVPMVCYVSITGFIVFNLIVAVICDAVSVIDKESRENERKEKQDKLKETRKLLFESSRTLFESSHSRISYLTDEVELISNRQHDMQHIVLELARELATMQREMNELLGIADNSDDSEEYQQESHMQNWESDEDDVDVEDEDPSKRGIRQSKKKPATNSTSSKKSAEPPPAPPSRVEGEGPTPCLRSESRIRTTRSVSFDDSVDKDTSRSVKTTSSIESPQFFL